MRIPPAISILVLCSVAQAQQVGPVDALTNPVRNPGFEQATEDGKGFAHWAFNISRSAKVSVAVDATGGRAGSQAPVFHNESPLEPHVYGRFVQGVAVRPGVRYRLSCWVRGENVSPGNHWTDWQSYQLMLPSGTFGWTRVECEFSTGSEQTGLDLGLNVVNLTGQLWVDDVQLRPLAAVDERMAGGKVVILCPQSLIVEQQALPVSVLWQQLRTEPARLRVEVHNAGGKAAEAEVAVKGREGQAAVSLKLQPAADDRGELTVRFLDPHGRSLGAFRRPLTLISARFARERLNAVGQQLAALREQMQVWRTRGLPLDYPQVTETVVSNFLPWVAEDLDHGEVGRAIQQLDELDSILRDAIAQCQAPPPVKALTVPRYAGGPVSISGGHFVSEVAWPDGGHELRPVFFNGLGHFTAVRRDIEKLPGYGLNIIQVEFGPDHVVQPDFSTNPERVTEFLGLLDRAQRAGVAVNLLISPHYFPPWALERWPELGGVNGGFIRFDVDAPQSRRVIETYLRAIIPPLRGHPALHSICLSNEPIYVNAPNSPYNRDQWHAWLTARHGTIQRLNERWGTDYASFAAVPIQNPDDLRPRPALYDWVSFNNRRFADFHRWMADIIHELAPTLPVHAKIMNLPFNRSTVTWGNDVEQFCDLSQIAGNDCSNYYIHEDSSAGNGGVAENLYYDLLRSMRGQPSFNSENHVVADRNWRPVPGIHMRNLVWQGAIHGQGASTVWVWERTYDNASDFAGSIMHRPAMCDAHGRAALDLMRLAPEVVALQDAPARVAVVYSICSQAWNPDYANSTVRAYHALSLLGEKVDFITAQQLAAGKGRDYQAILLPRVTHFEHHGFQALKAFSRLPGKQLVALGEGCLGMDEYGRPRSTAGFRFTVLPAGESVHDLRDALASALRLERPVRVVEAATGGPPQMATWRWGRDGDRSLVNICNYARKPVRLRVQCQGATRLTNLITGQPIGAEFALGMLEPILIEAR